MHKPINAKLENTDRSFYIKLLANSEKSGSGHIIMYDSFLNRPQVLTNTSV